MVDGKALIVAGDHVLLAGARADGRPGGKLDAIERTTGKLLASSSLGIQPAFAGLSVADGYQAARICAQKL